jgi:hypothetical protein
MERLIPKYPVYVISKGRADCCLTARFLIQDKVPFSLVIEPQEESAYRKYFPKANILILPFSNLGLGGIPARNWVWEHAKVTGAERHWILDDNIDGIVRRYKAKRFPCRSGVAFAAVEDFIDRYQNIAIGGLNYSMFCPDRQKIRAFFLNVHIYSCLLILNSLPQRWRGRYNEDTDLTLQVLAAGWCTVLTNVFTIKKKPTMTMKGGNSAQLYKADGRLKMARSLERMWPGVVTVKRKFRRPQHSVYDAWSKFDTQLKLKPGILLKDMKPNEYGLTVRQMKPIKSQTMARMLGINSPLKAKP